MKEMFPFSGYTCKCACLAMQGRVQEYDSPKNRTPFLRILVKNIESPQNINLTMKYTICKAIKVKKSILFLCDQLAKAGSKFYLLIR